MYVSFVWEMSQVRSCGGGDDDDDDGKRKRKKR